MIDFSALKKQKGYFMFLQNVSESLETLKKNNHLFSGMVEDIEEFVARRIKASYPVKIMDAMKDKITAEQRLSN